MVRPCHGGRRWRRPGLTSDDAAQANTDRVLVAARGRIIISRVEVNDARCELAVQCGCRTLSLCSATSILDGRSVIAAQRIGHGHDVAVMRLVAAIARDEHGLDDVP